MAIARETEMETHQCINQDSGRMIEYRSRKKQSNFDVTPDAIIQRSPEINDMLIKTILKFNTQQEIPTWTPATDFAYTQRIQNALEKNFRFVEMRDVHPEYNLVTTQQQQQKQQPRCNQTLFDSQQKSVATLRSGLGTGTSLPVTQSLSRENCRIYISGLPTFITTEDIDILFSSVGKIKKIKIYEDSNGVKKGDALVTYSNGDLAQLACLKLNKLNIGEGHIINVVMAEYKDVSISKSDDFDYNSSVDTPAFDKTLDEYLIQLQNAPAPITRSPMDSLWAMLPLDSDHSMFPVLLLANAYDPRVFLDKNTDMNKYFQEIQTELLVKCCDFGRVKSFLISSPTGISEDCINCADALHQQRFDNRILLCGIFLPNDPRAENVHPPPIPAICQKLMSSNSIEPSSEVIENDLDKFLNSLL